MALETRDAIGALTERWRRLGHDIGFGIGIAHGFATLDTIGFEGRFDYAAIGTAIRANNIYRVTFLTCRVGNAIDFIKKISLDWGCLVKAYKRFVVYQVVGNNVRAFLEGDAPGSGTNVPQGESQLPQQDFVTVGPPIAAPTAHP